MNKTLLVVAAVAAFVACGGRWRHVLQVLPGPEGTKVVQPVGPAVPQVQAPADVVAAAKAAFAGRTDARAYAAYYEGLARYVERTGDYAGSTRWFQKVRDRGHLADNPTWATTVLQVMSPFKPLVTQEAWTEALKAQYIQSFRQLSSACLQAG